MTAHVIEFKRRSLTFDEAVGAALDKHLTADRVDEWIRLLEEDVVRYQDEVLDCAKRLRHSRLLFGMLDLPRPDLRSIYGADSHPSKIGGFSDAVTCG